MDRHCEKAKEHEAEWQNLYDVELPCAYCLPELSFTVTPPRRHQIPARPESVTFRKTLSGSGKVFWTEE